MLGLKLNHVSKSGPWCYSMHWGYRWQVKYMTITNYHCGNTVCNSICHTFSCNMRVYSTIIQLPQHPLWKYKYTQMLGFHTHWEPKFFYIWYMDEMDIQYDLLSLRNCKLTKYCYFELSQPNVPSVRSPNFDRFRHKFLYETKIPALRLTWNISVIYCFFDIFW